MGDEYHFCLTIYCLIKIEIDVYCKLFLFFFLLFISNLNPPITYHLSPPIHLLSLTYLFKFKIKEEEYVVEYVSDGLKLVECNVGV